MSSALQFSRKRLPAIFWFLALLSITIWSLLPGADIGWDLKVYHNALNSLRAGHDPYLDGMAVQRIFHAHLAEHRNDAPPYTYVYSPLTLPLLRVLLHLPLAWVGMVYWTLYALGTLAALVLGWRCVRERERPVFALLAPAAVFFPGLLQHDTFLSGNVATILYGVVLAAAWVGWTRGRWLPFYAAVVLASCFKAPLLSLVVIAPFSARGHWIRAGLTAAAGVLLFAMQPHIWPSLFQHYLQAVDLQFSFNRDFSSSPAGLVANALFRQFDYHKVSLIAYLLYAVPVFWVLFRLGVLYRAQRLHLQQWMPLVLVGTVLLNPRIMEYDVAPITLPLALLGYRFFAGEGSVRKGCWGLGTVFAVANVLAALKPSLLWRPVEGTLLLCLFAAGTVQAFRSMEAEATRASPELASAGLEEALRGTTLHGV